jgi:multidrug efflux pump subunit AcrA (membrane-fusion protein)
VAEPAQAPYKTFVVGAGLLEASTENISVGTPVSGVVAHVFVTVGARVSKGDRLFDLDDRQLKAQLQAERAAVSVAASQLAKLEAMPRLEDLPPLDAKVRESSTNLADVKAELAMWESVTDKRAVSQDQVDRKRFAVRAAETRLAQAEAELALTKAGAWKPDIEVARAELASAKATEERTLTELDRLVIRAPVDGTIMQIKIRAGEFAVAGVLSNPLIQMGNIDRMNVRVDIDENDAWRVKPTAQARAFARGNRDIFTKLDFVRFEPMVIPKKSLTGESTERVDTRVLQVLYGFDRGDLPLYVGQQMDVFIEGPEAGTKTTRDSATSQPSTQPATAESQPAPARSEHR